VRGKLFVQRKAGFFGEEFEVFFVDVAQVFSSLRGEFSMSPQLFFCPCVEMALRSAARLERTASQFWEARADWVSVQRERTDWRAISSLSSGEVEC